MAKTKAERMKEYRARKKALMGDEWLRRENNRVKSYFVPITDLSDAKQNHKRELNRKHAEKYRKKQKLTNDNETVEDIDEGAEPSTSNEDSNGVSSTTNDSNPMVVKMPFTSQPSKRESRGRKRVSRALAKQYRKNERLADQNEEIKRKLNSAMKRLNRWKQKQQASTHTPSTPRSKSDSLLREAGVDPRKSTGLRQKLVFAECVTEEIKAAARSNNQQVVMRVVSGNIMKKYKLKKSLATHTGLNRRKMNSVKKSVEITKRSRNKAINMKIDEEIREFLERDDNSRLLPGKADAVKVGKQKVQKRVLNDYMYNLHVKFLAESTFKLSHASFCKKKPSSIAHVNFSSRSVCLCQKHQNFALKLRCLKNYKINTITSPDRFMETYTTEEDLDNMLQQGINVTTIKYQEWKRKKLHDGKERMRVVDLELPRGEFIEMMKETHRSFASHIHKVIAQYKGVKQMKEKLPVNHVLIQMDFAENYTCQNMEEVQSAYWNATAVTLHPTVIYQRDENGQLKHDSIVFVSEVLQHNASMVLAIIDKIVHFVKEANNNVKVIHFWTDSPTSQYRNKTVFDLISRMESMYGVAGSWHYFESGHGKRPCDGIGGTTKRNADNAVKQGKLIIQDAHDFFRWATETTSQIGYQKITEEEFNISKETVERRNMNLKPIKGTMKVHSVIGTSPENVRTRETVCVCEDCFDENGFNENTKCLWEKQSLAKPIKATNTSKANNNDPEKTAEETRNNTADQYDGINEQTQPGLRHLKENDYVVISYDNQHYIGQVITLDEDDDEVEVSCMEACGKIEGRYRWPRILDKLWIARSTVLKQIVEPQATGKSKRIFSIDADTIDYMKA